MPATAQSRGCTAPEKEKDTQWKLVTLIDCWVNVQLYIGVTNTNKIVPRVTYCCSMLKLTH